MFSVEEDVLDVDVINRCNPVAIVAQMARWVLRVYFDCDAVTVVAVEGECGVLEAAAAESMVDSIILLSTHNPLWGPSEEVRTFA